MNLAPDHWTEELPFYYQYRVVPKETVWDVWRKHGDGAERVAAFERLEDAKEYVAWLNSKKSE